MDNLKGYLAPLGRLLMSSLFIWAGYHKLINPGGTAQYFANAHVPVPDVSVWIAVIIELIGGLLILVGFQTRWVALVLAIFCLGTGFGVHLPAGDVPQHDQLLQEPGDGGRLPLRGGLRPGRHQRRSRHRHGKGLGASGANGPLPL